MTKTVTRIIASVAALSLVATPIVAQAKTRAGDSAATYSAPVAAPGLGRDAEGEGQAQGGLIWLIVGIGAVTSAVYAGLIASGVIEQGDAECISPGAC